MSNRGGEGYSFGFIADSAQHDKYCVTTCFENLAEEIISIIPDINEIIFFSDGAAGQFKNRYVIQHLTTMMEKFDINFSWNYFVSSHGKGNVDSIGGTLKRLVRMEIMTGLICSSATEFVDIYCRRTRTIIVNLVQQAQVDATRITLEITFKRIFGIPDVRQQHHTNVLHQDVVEYALYATRNEMCLDFDIFYRLCRQQKCSNFTLLVFFGVVLLISVLYMIFTCLS